MATPDAVLAAALEAVALGAECAAEDCSERLEVYADDRLYDLVHHAQTHYAAIAKALLEAEAEGQRLRGGDGDVRVLVARELLPSLAEWSEPLQVRMEGEQLVFRRPAALARRDHPTAEPEE